MGDGLFLILLCIGAGSVLSTQRLFAQLRNYQIEAEVYYNYAAILGEFSNTRTLPIVVACCATDTKKWLAACIVENRIAQVISA